MHIETLDTAGMLANAALAGKDLSISTSEPTREVKFRRVTGKLVARNEGAKRWIVRTDRLPLPAVEKSKVDGLRFRMLAERWREKSLNMSSITAMVMLPEYQMIIGMGDAAVPLILRDLRDSNDDPDHWHWALNAITGANPVSEVEMGNTRKMADAWLRWAADGNIR